MQRPAFWLMSDPPANPQFRRGWTLPPIERKRRPAGTGTADFESTISNVIDTADREKSQARRAAEALFRGRAA